MSISACISAVAACICATSLSRVITRSEHANVDDNYLEEESDEEFILNDKYYKWPYYNIVKRKKFSKKKYRIKND